MEMLTSCLVRSESVYRGNSAVKRPTPTLYANNMSLDRSQPESGFVRRDANKMVWLIISFEREDGAVYR